MFARSQSLVQIMGHQQLVVKNKPTSCKIPQKDLFARRSVDSGKSPVNREQNSLSRLFRIFRRTQLKGFVRI